MDDRGVQGLDEEEGFDAGDGLVKGGDLDILEITGGLEDAGMGSFTGRGKEYLQGERDDGEGELSFPLASSLTGMGRRGAWGEEGARTSSGVGETEEDGTCLHLGPVGPSWPRQGWPHARQLRGAGVTAAIACSAVAAC